VTVADRPPNVADFQDHVADVVAQLEELEGIARRLPPGQLGGLLKDLRVLVGNEEQVRAGPGRAVAVSGDGILGFLQRIARDGRRVAGAGQDVARPGRNASACSCHHMEKRGQGETPAPTRGATS